MVLFEGVADDYDAFRPGYPVQLFDYLDTLVDGLAGRHVADVGAGTGIVTRQLLHMGAVVTAVDAGIEMLGRAVRRTPGLRAVNADGAAYPFRGSMFDLVTFGQSWHWIDQGPGAGEAARILRHGGHWAAWWNHPWADGQEWFERYQALLEVRCPGYSRHQRDVDWASDALASRPEFLPPDRVTFSWVRQVPVEAWMTDQSTHSIFITLSADDRQRLLVDLEAIVRTEFAVTMQVPYQTRLWAARRS